MAAQIPQLMLNNTSKYPILLSQIEFWVSPAGFEPATLTEG